MTRYGAIDIGTNSVRVLVAEVDGSVEGGIGTTAPLRTLERRMRITRLGQGVHEARALAPDAIDRTLDVLREYREVLDAFGVEHVRATATSAARDASNREDFFGPAAEILGFELELLAGDDEARLSFLGATAELPGTGAKLVMDIGGGSTELIWGTDAPERLVSIDVGCVRLTEQFLHSDPPAAEELSIAVSFVRDEVADFARTLPDRGGSTLVGLAGTVTTIAAVEIGLAEYDRDRIHHYHLTKVAAEDVFRTLATESIGQRRHNPGLAEGRVDVIVGGAVILVTVLRTLGYDEVLVSEADILDGLVRSQLPASSPGV